MSNNTHDHQHAEQEENDEGFMFYYPVFVGIVKRIEKLKEEIVFYQKEYCDDQNGSLKLIKIYNKMERCKYELKKVQEVYDYNILYNAGRISRPSGVCL